MVNILYKKITSIRLIILAFTLAIFTLSACSLKANEEKPALLPENSKQTRLEIIKLIRQSLGGGNIPIAQDVFQNTSRILLGKATVKSPNGIDIIRTNESNTIIFSLVKQGDDCLLKRINPPQVWKLNTTACFSANIH